MPYIVQVTITKIDIETNWWGSVQPERAKKLGGFIESLKLMTHFEMKPMHNNRTMVTRFFFKSVEDSNEFWSKLNQHEVYLQQQQYNIDNEIISARLERFVSNSEIRDGNLKM